MRQTLVLLFVSWVMLAVPLAAQSTVKSLTIEQAVAAGLANDPGIRSGNWDAVSARAKAQDAKYRMLPSLSASVGYTQLSQEPSPAPVSGTGYDGLINYLM